MAKMFYASVGAMFLILDQDGDCILEPRTLVAPALFTGEENCRYSAELACQYARGVSVDDIYIHTVEIETEA